MSPEMRPKNVGTFKKRAPPAKLHAVCSPQIYEFYKLTTTYVSINRYDLSEDKRINDVTVHFFVYNK